MADAKKDEKPEDKPQDQFAKLMLGTAAAWGATKLVTMAYDALVIARRTKNEEADK